MTVSCIFQLYAPLPSKRKKTKTTVPADVERQHPVEFKTKLPETKRINLFPRKDKKIEIEAQKKRKRSTIKNWRQERVQVTTSRPQTSALQKLNLY